ncbi:unnamed protein product [Rotaria sp. Silwood2]|nr:unnamed protein product [Rotaria sp. Silwood2]CAF4000362.1 unnamed protein product [Rotaria sp. Silwood2]
MTILRLRKVNTILPYLQNIFFPAHTNKNKNLNYCFIFFFNLRNGPIKPDSDTLLARLCDSLKQILVVDGTKFSINVQLFKGDLPARALACKHIHHNGYYACLECDQ